MDHLPARNEDLRIPVPYLSDIEYDGGEFFTYGHRVGWDFTKLWNCDLQGKTVAEAARFLQTWLYFGLLHVVFGPAVGIKNSDFIEEVDGVRLVTTRNLPIYVLKWRSYEQSRTTEEKQARFRQLKEFLERYIGLTIRWCRPSIEQQLQNPTRWPLSPEICLSIIVLGDTIVKAGFEILRQRFDLDWGDCDLLKYRMRDAGWCPRAIATLCKGQQIHNLWYASTLGLPPVEQPHTGCDERLCDWEQVDQATYKTQHRAPCTNCSYLGPETDALVQEIAIEETPIVAYDPGNPENQFKLSSTKVTPEYVAISHVC